MKGCACECMRVVLYASYLVFSYPNSIQITLKGVYGVHACKRYSIVSLVITCQGIEVEMKGCALRYRIVFSYLPIK